VNNNMRVQEIDEALENIFLAEEKVTEEGYQQGFEEGRAQGNTEAYHLGYHRGAEISAELGYYYGTVALQLEKSPSPKVKSLLEDLKIRIESFPKENLPDFDIFGTLTEIKGKYRRVCALLKIDSKFPEATATSF